MKPTHLARHLHALARICHRIASGQPNNAVSLGLIAGVHPRTVNRYLEFLRQEMGAPIVWSDDKQQYVLARRWSFGRAICRFVEVA